MIYVTEQQVVVTAVLIAAVGFVALFLGMWWGIRRGREMEAEEQHWAREQARARRVHPAYREPPEVAHEARLAHEEQTLTAVLEPTAVISPDTSPEEFSATAWTARMAADMDRFLAGLIGGTDEQLREITR